MLLRKLAALCLPGKMNMGTQFSNCAIKASQDNFGRLRTFFWTKLIEWVTYFVLMDSNECYSWNSSAKLVNEIQLIAKSCNR